MLHINTNDTDSYRNIATAYFIMKKYDNAKQVLEKLLQISPEDTYANDLLKKINMLID